MSDQRSGPTAGPGLTPLLSSGGSGSAMPLHWHLVSAGVIAMMATGFLAVLDADEGREVSQASVRRAETLREVAVIAKPVDRMQMARAAEASPARAVAAGAPLPTWSPSLHPVLPAESAPAQRSAALAEPPADQAARRDAPAPPMPAAAPPETKAPVPPTSPAPVSAEPAPPAPVQIAAPAPIRTTAPAPKRVEPAETASIEKGIAASGKADATAASKDVVTSAKTPTDCLPQEFRAVLADVAARFGTVALVSTTQLHTDNHSPGSARALMHANCKAMDFKVGPKVQEVVAYLKTRKEVNGINSYRNGVVHIDLNPAFKTLSARSETPPNPTRRPR